MKRTLTGPSGFRAALEHKALERRRKKTEALLDQLSGSRRTVLSGGPRTGKSTLAVRAGERYSRKVRHADSLIGSTDWSGASDEVAKWIGEDGDWIVEGVTAPRALRKWLAEHPGEKLDLTIIHTREPVQVQTDKQRAMSKGVETVWKSIRDELKKRGATVIERDADEPESSYAARAPQPTTEPAPTPEPAESDEPYTIPNARE